MTDYIPDVATVFGKHKELAEGALAQITDEAFFRTLGERSPAIAIIVKHVGGNLRSRWTDFLTTDGEKPDRNRDGEFEITPADSRASVMAGWDRGFATLFATLESLTPADLTKTITVRGEALTVIQATNRSLAHTAYHVGQLTYLCRLLAEGDWKWLTVPPAQKRK